MPNSTSVAASSNVTVGAALIFEGGKTLLIFSESFVRPSSK